MSIKKALLSLIVVCFILRGSPALPEDFAYALRFQTHKPDCLVRFDVDKDIILKEITLPNDKDFNNFVVDEKGGCFLSNYRGVDSYGRDICYYDPATDKIEKFIDLGDKFGPHQLFLTDKELIAEIEGNDKTREKSGVIFIDRKSKKITGSVFLKEDDPHYVQANINDIFFDGSKYLFLVSFYMFRSKDVNEFLNTRDAGDIYVVDVEKKQIVKIIQVDRQYRLVYGVCNIGDKIYVTAGEFGNTRDEYGLLPPTNEVLVYSLATGELLKKIKVDTRPFNLIYDRSVRKLFVTHRDDNTPNDTVEVIDPKTDDIIDRINIPSRLMFSVVAPGKMYVTVGKNFLQEHYASPRLLVLDTKTDKIIKEFEGVYTGISLNSKY
jgi:hypothetical protein